MISEWSDLDNKMTDGQENASDDERTKERKKKEEKLHKIRRKKATQIRRQENR